MKISKLCVLTTISFFVITLSLISPQGKAQAYYGSTGLYGSGLSGGLYGGYGGMYGGLMGGMYGGLMGSMYGGLMGGMYGGLMGGMYGGLMVGMGGMYGGLYGNYSPFGLQNMYYNIGTGTGLNYQVPFLQIAPMLGVSGLYNSLFPGLFNMAPSVPAAAIAAEQVGTWKGTWTSAGVAGPLTINLAVDPLLASLLSGYVQLLGNPYLGSLVSVTGETLNNQIYIEGSGLGIGSQNIKIEIIATLTSATSMIGTYTMINNTSIISTGAFDAELLPALIL